jgi:ribosome modulation factor
VHQDLNRRTAWLDGTRDSHVIYTGYAFNLIKKEGNLEGIHGGGEGEKGGSSLVAAGWGGSGVMKWWILSAAAGSGTSDSRSGRWLPASAPRAGHHQPFLCASSHHSCRPSPWLSGWRATSSTSGARLLGRPPPGELAWPAVGGHPHPWGGRPEGG